MTPAGTVLGALSPVTKGQVVAGTVRVAVEGVGPARQVETVVVKPKGQGRPPTEGADEGLTPGYVAVTT